MVCSDDLNKRRITKNSLKLPKDSDKVEVEKPRVSINEKLINKLRDACNSRSLLAKQVFQGEWTAVHNVLLPRNVHRTITLSLSFLIALQVIRHTLKVNR